MFYVWIKLGVVTFGVQIGKLVSNYLVSIYIRFRYSTKILEGLLVWLSLI